MRTDNSSWRMGKDSIVPILIFCGKLHCVMIRETVVKQAFFKAFKYHVGTDAVFLGETTKFCMSILDQTLSGFISHLVKIDGVGGCVKSCIDAAYFNSLFIKIAAVFQTLFVDWFPDHAVNIIFTQ